MRLWRAAHGRVYVKALEYIVTHDLDSHRPGQDGVGQSVGHSLSQSDTQRCLHALDLDERLGAGLDRALTLLLCLLPIT